MNEMTVIKRDGRVVDVSFDKILNRIKNLGSEVNISLNYTELAIQMIDQLYDKIETCKIDEISAQLCASQATKHPNYGKLASKITISNLHKNTNPSFSKTIAHIQDQINHNLCSNFIQCVEHHGEIYDTMIVHARDDLIDYFGYKTLERAYLMKIKGVIVERPQYMWIRVAIGLHGEDIEKVRETYNLLSLKYFTHATPTLFNAGTKRPQLSSCYLLGMQSDSIEGIYDTLKDCALISKWAGGIGLHIHNIRARGSPIHGTNGTSNGLIPMLKPFNETARYVDQGGGRRNGSFAIYLSPEHPDIEDWLDLKKNTGDENARARDLFYGLWIPDLFMKRVHENTKWSLFCPKTCPNLNLVYGKEYEKLYTHYEQSGYAKKVIGARSLWFKILDAQMETGTPYLLFKDAANEKSNQKNLGPIQSSNLCAEIIEYSDKDETAVCNLASIGLSSFVNKENIFDYEKLHEVTKVITRNLNRIIDINFYPTDKTKKK